MRTCIDISDEDGPYPFGNGKMPDYAVIQDDMNIVICMGDTELRMTYAQFDHLMDKANAWRESIPATSECDLTKE